MFDGQLPVVSREKAIQRGLDRYFTGRLCAFDHMCERYIRNGKCIECAKANISSSDVERFLKNKNRRRWTNLQKQQIKQATPPWVNDRFVIDHIVPLQGYYMLEGEKIEVCGLNVLWNLQVLTEKENKTKYNQMNKRDLEIACSLQKFA